MRKAEFGVRSAEWACDALPLVGASGLVAKFLTLPDQEVLPRTDGDAAARQREDVVDGLAGGAFEDGEMLVHGVGNPLSCPGGERCWR